jgi:hypothetical protein
VRAVVACADPAYDWDMTTTPMEPESDPQVVPSGDPSVNPVEVPDPPEPQTDPQTRPDGTL